MKKKILSIIFTICLILPCAFIFSACGNNEKQKYTVIWKNYDGSILETDIDVEEGTLPTFDGEDNPTKPSTDQYDYTFSGWSPEVKKLTQNTTYIAQYSSELTHALISFDLNGGQTSSATSSKLVSTIDASDFFFDVTKTGSKFLGWSYNDELIFDESGNKEKEISIEEDMQFVASFQVKQKYTVIWKNYDGNILDVDVDVEEGTLPTFDGEDNPTKPSTDQYNYTFSGWSPEVEKLTQNTTYIAQFSSELTHALISFDLNGGQTNSATSSKLVSTIDVSDFFFDVTKTNNQFLGWSYNGELIFDENGNKKKDIEIEETMQFVAYFDDIVSLSFSYSNSKAGSATGSGDIVCGSDVNIQVSLNSGYRFIGAYDGENLISNSLSFTYTMPVQDKELEFRFGFIDYTIYYYNAKGGSILKTKTINVESDFDITEVPSKDGHTFTCWRLDSNDQIVNHISSGTLANITIYADFSINKYTVSVVSLDESKGSVSGGVTDYYGTLFSITASAKDENVFVGWYEDETCTKKVSPMSIYADYIKSKDVTYYALFMTETQKAELLKKTNGEIPVLSSDGKYITYGIYPKTIVSDIVLLNTLNVLKEDPQDALKENGFYLYNGEYYYYLEKANPSWVSFKFTNGKTIVRGQNYWFKCEAIRWKVLKVDGNNFTVISDIILGNVPYTYSESYAYNNLTSFDGINFYGKITNYTTSNIRTFLNTTFLQNYFPSDDKFIIKTHVSNELGEGDKYQYFEGPDTDDKFYIPSLKELTNGVYFANQSSRGARATDYALATGTEDYYWTRTPIVDGETSEYTSGTVMYVVTSDGFVSDSYYSNNPAYLTNPKYGFRPMATFDLSELLSD